MHKEIVLSHYKSFWNKPINLIKVAISFEGLSNDLLIAEFSPKTEEHDWIYATVGLSQNFMVDPKHDTKKRAELFLYSRIRNSEIVNYLAEVGSFPFRNSTFLGVGHTLSGLHPITKGSQMTEAIFLPPFSERKEFEVVHLEEGSHAQMLWVVPLFPEERAFAANGNWRKLVDYFYETKPDTSDFFRELKIYSSGNN